MLMRCLFSGTVSTNFVADCWYRLKVDKLALVQMKSDRPFKHWINWPLEQVKYFERIVFLYLYLAKVAHHATRLPYPLRQKNNSKGCHNTDDQAVQMACCL